MSDAPQDINREWLDERFSGIMAALSAAAMLNEEIFKGIRKEVADVDKKVDGNQEYEKSKRLVVYGTLFASFLSFGTAMFFTVVTIS
jgi:hypothetical protein